MTDEVLHSDERHTSIIVSALCARHSAVDAEQTEGRLGDEDHEAMLAYFVMAADHMINSGGLSMRGDGITTLDAG